MCYKLSQCQLFKNRIKSNLGAISCRWHASDAHYLDYDYVSAVERISRLMLRNTLSPSVISSVKLINVTKNKCGRIRSFILCYFLCEWCVEFCSKFIRRVFNFVRCRGWFYIQFKAFATPHLFYFVAIVNVIAIYGWNKLWLNNSYRYD